MSGDDLIVAGGGPAGATLAALAARSGARVTLLERASFPREKVCGEFVSAEGVAVIDRLGLLESLTAAGARRIDSARITSGYDRPLDLELGERSALGVSRSRLDQALVDLAVDRGVRLEQPYEVVRPLVEDGRIRGVWVRRTGTRGKLEPRRARVIVAADGRRSSLGRALLPRLGDPQRSGPGSWIGLKIHLDGRSIPFPPRVELHAFAGGYAGIGPIEDGRINLCLLAQVAVLRAAGGTPRQLLDARLRRLPALAEALADSKPVGRFCAVGPLRFGPRCPAVPGVLFIGDAAGTIDPFTGAGIAHALCAAERVLPHALDAATRGEVDARVVVAWTREWRSAFNRPTHRARRLGWFLEHSRIARIALYGLSASGTQLAQRWFLQTRVDPRDRA